MKYYWLILILIYMGCQQHKSETIIAKVGDEVLTLEEAKEHVDSNQNRFQDELRNYTMHWVNEELLYQEARQANIEKTEQFQNRILEIKKQIADQQYVDEQINTANSAIDEKTLHDYFDKNEKEFFLHENYMKLNIATFSSREYAAAFASQISHGGVWREILNTIRQDSITGKNLIAYVLEKYYTQHAVIEEVWKIASSLNTSDVSFPVKTQEGYSIIQLVARKKEGELADFEIVKEEVRERVMIEQQRKQFESLLENLRKKYKVEILLNDITNNDTNPSARHD